MSMIMIMIPQRLLGKFPVKGTYYISFGRRRHPITGKHSHHKGIDIAAPTGTDIQPIKGGMVTIVVTEVVLERLW